MARAPILTYATTIYPCLGLPPRTERWDLQFEDMQDWAQREAMGERVGGPLLGWLGGDKPPQHRVRHKVWKKQLADKTRQLLLGADRARQRAKLKVLAGGRQALWVRRQAHA